MVDGKPAAHSCPVRCTRVRFPCFNAMWGALKFQNVRSARDGNGIYMDHKLFQWINIFFRGGHFLMKMLITSCGQVLSLSCCSYRLSVVYSNVIRPTDPSNIFLYGLNCCIYFRLHSVSVAGFSALPVEQQPSQWQQKSIRIKFYSEGWEYNRTNIIISESNAKINWPTPGQCQGFIKLSFQIVPCNWSSRPADRPRRSMLLARRPKPRDRLDDYI